MINLQPGEKLNILIAFEYVRSTMAGHDNLDEEITRRELTGWLNWKRVSGVLCVRNISLKVRGKMNRTVVRPAMANIGLKDGQ